MVKLLFSFYSFKSFNAEQPLWFISIFQAPGQPQIEDLFQPYVLMKAGGNIIVQETAALCAIDVNRSSDTRGNLAINLDAVAEIGRHIRLRNLGGIIVVDFLRMKTKKEKEKLLQALDDIVVSDPCTVQIHGFTNLGMIEMTRKRRTPPLQDRLDLALD